MRGILEVIQADFETNVVFRFIVMLSGHKVAVQARVHHHRADFGNSF